jgi:purine-nucleoside phosphorylase
MLRTLGADMVGMSTVMEAIAARYLGARVGGISVISNPAAGLTEKPPSHEEVLRAAEQARPRLVKLLRGVLSRLLTL